MTDPNSLSIARYRRHAAGYDASAARTMALRARTIGLLGLQAGEVVIDAGAGTGLSYPGLLQAVGPSGRVLACEQSPEMFALAEARVRALPRPEQVAHQLAQAEQVQFGQLADAVLFNYAHDITRSPVAVANLLAQVRPGGRVAMAGMRFFPWWTGPLNLLAWLKNRPYNARAADLWSPWDKVQARCVHFERWTTQAGMGYIALGRLPGAAQGPAAGPAVLPP